MARPRKIQEAEGFPMVVTIACLLLGGGVVVRAGDVISVSENVRKTLLHSKAAKDA